jgi:hypothetical protein
VSLGPAGVFAIELEEIELLLDVPPAEAMIVEVGDVVVEDADEDQAYHKGEDDATLEVVSAGATAVSRGVEVALEDDEDNQADHEGDDEDDMDDNDDRLADVAGAATAVSTDVDADVNETALEVQVVSLPYWRRCRCACALGRWVACVTEADRATIAT